MEGDLKKEGGGGRVIPRAFRLSYKLAGRTLVIVLRHVELIRFSHQSRVCFPVVPRRTSYTRLVFLGQQALC